MSRYVIPEPGGYQREAGAAFGSGTLRGCRKNIHRWFVRRSDGWYWERPDERIGPRHFPTFDEQPEGTERCADCGKVDTA